MSRLNSRIQLPQEYDKAVVARVTDAIDTQVNALSARSLPGTATAKQIVFGAADGSLTQSSIFSWDDSAKKLTLSASTITEGGSSLLTIQSGGGLNVSAASASSGAAGSDVALNAGSGTAGNVSGGQVLNQAGSGFGAGSGGAVGLTGGNGGSSAGATGGGAVVQGGGGPGGGGSAVLQSGATITSGAGAEVDVVAADGVGVSQDGGNVVLFAGSNTGSGVKGRVFIGNSGGNYAVANATHALSITNVGPAALTASTIAGWLPILVDGNLSYLPYWR